MKQITVNIPDNKYFFFLELVNTLGFEKVEEKALVADQEALEGLEQEK